MGGGEGRTPQLPRHPARNVPRGSRARSRESSLNVFPIAIIVDFLLDFVRSIGKRTEIRETETGIRLVMGEIFLSLNFH